MKPQKQKIPAESMKKLLEGIRRIRNQAVGSPNGNQGIVGQGANKETASDRPK